MSASRKLLMVFVGLPFAAFSSPRASSMSASLKLLMVFVDLPFAAFSFPTHLPMADGLHAQQDLFACGKQRS